MAASETISITLPPDLLTQAKSLAKREHRTVSELLGEALQQYTTEKTKVALQRFQELAERGRAYGEAMGIRSEEDVDRILGNFRTPGLD